MGEQSTKAYIYNGDSRMATAMSNYMHFSLEEFGFWTCSLEKCKHCIQSVNSLKESTEMVSTYITSFPHGSLVNNLPLMQEMQVQSDSPSQISLALLPL